MQRSNPVRLSIDLAPDIARMVCTALFSRKTTIAKCTEILIDMCKRGGVADTLSVYRHGAYIPMILKQHNVITLLRSSWNNYYYVSRICGTHGLLAGWKQLQGITITIYEKVIPVKILEKIKRRKKYNQPIQSHEECVELTLREIRKQAGAMWKILKIAPGGREAAKLIEMTFYEAADCFCKELLDRIDRMNLTGEERRKAVREAMRRCLEAAKAKYLNR